MAVYGDNDLYFTWEFVAKRLLDVILLISVFKKIDATLYVASIQLS
jgi:hypothetical protein